jgi:Xaa-Pro aminopeptidase
VTHDAPLSHGAPAIAIEKQWWLRVIGIDAIKCSICSDDHVFGVLAIDAAMMPCFDGASRQHKASRRNLRLLANFIDVTPDIDAIKAIKSDEEAVLIRRTAVQDEVFADVLKEIRPGLRDTDVTSIAQRKGQMLGSEQGIFLGGSSPLGIRSPFVPRYLQGRTLEKDDHLSLLIEINGPGGFYTEIARTIVLGKASAN